MTTAHRIAARHAWLKIDPATGGVKAFVTKEKDATEFATAELARAALAKAFAATEASFAARFAPGKAPSRSLDRVANDCASWDTDAKALALAIVASRLDACKVEAFEAPEPMAVRMALPSIYALVADNGFYAREGATGYMTLVDQLDEATLFESATQAQKYFEVCSPSKETEALARTMRVIELALTPAASLDPFTLAPSDNLATGMMRSLRLAKEMDAVALPAGAKKKTAKSL